jgi:hypothetical protein
MHIAFAYTCISRPHAHTNHTTIPSQRFTPAPAVQSISTIRPYPRVPQAATGTGLASGHEPQLKILRTIDVIQMVVPLLYLAVPCCTLLYRAVPCCTLLYVAVPCCSLHLHCVSEVKTKVAVNMSLVSRPNCTHTHTHTHTHRRNQTQTTKFRTKPSHMNIAFAYICLSL